MLANQIKEKKFDHFDRGAEETSLYATKYEKNLSLIKEWRK